MNSDKCDTSKFNMSRLEWFADTSDRDHPEVKKEPNMSGIYSHICHTCKAAFFGYKRRVYCLPCSKNTEDKSQ